MKKLTCVLLICVLLTACGAPEPSASVAEEPEYTEEELFLQKAYWYLQSDEKELFTWENGKMEDYCAEGSHPVIGPEGQLDIQGRELTRVKYVFSPEERAWEGTIDLYFDGEDFVGTDSGNWIDGVFHPISSGLSRGGRYWDGDVSYWLFLSEPEISMDDTLTLTCVLRNNGEKRDFCACAPYFTYVEFFQEGRARVGGQDTSAQYFTLDSGEVFVETHTLTPGNYQSIDWQAFTPGACTVLTYVTLSKELDTFNFSMTKTATFTITE